MQNTGTLVTAAIRPNDDLDRIATAYSTEVKGGHHTYATKAQRDGIISERRDWGMLCTVYADSTPANNITWQLTYGHSSTNIMDNTNWTKFSGSSSGSSSGSAYWIDPVLAISSNEPGSPVDGDRYILGVTPVGTNWSSFVEGQVVMWDSNLNVWTQLSPMDGMSVRVDGVDNSIYRYEGTSGKWVREKVNQVIYLSATSSNAVNYTATDSRVFSYDIDSLYVVQFGTVNSGTTLTLNINGLGSKTIKQQVNAGLLDFTGLDINPNLYYPLVYDGTYFRLSKPSSEPTMVRYRISSGESVTVPAYQEYLVYGDLEVQGMLNIDPYGKVVVINGAFNVAPGATVSNSGNVQLVTLSTTTSNVAVKKYTETLTIDTNTQIVHNLGTQDISVSVYNGYDLVMSGLTIEIGSINDIYITSTSQIVGARVVIMG